MRIPSLPCATAAAAMLPLLLAGACNRPDAHRAETAPSAPAAPPEPELNPDRVESLYFREWHRSRPGIIATKGLSELRYLAQPGGTPTEFSDYEVDLYPSEAARAMISPSGRYELSVNEINERVESRGCCAVQLFDYQVMLTDRRSPGAPVKLAEGPGARWESRGWTSDSRRILVSGEGKLFLLNVETRDTLTVSSNEGVMHTALAEGGRSIFLIRVRDEQTRLERFDVPSRQLRTLLAPAGDEPVVSVSPDGSVLALLHRAHRGETTLRTENRLMLFRGADGIKLVEHALPEGNVDIRSGWRADGSAIAFDLAGEHHAHDIYSVDTRTGELTRWYPPPGRTSALYKTR